MLAYLTAPHSTAIVSVEVEKETPKRFYLKRGTAVKIRGHFYYIPDLVDKNSHKYKVFTDLAAANRYCLGVLRREEANLVGMLEKVRAEIAQWEGA